MSGKGEKAWPHRLWWEDKGFLFPLLLSKFINRALLLSTSRTLHQSTRDRTKNQPRRKEKKINEMPELMWTLGPLLSFYPTSNSTPLSYSLHRYWHLGSEPTELNCTFSRRQSFLAGPATEKSTVESLSLGACTTQMKLHRSKYRASRQSYSPSWLHFSKEPLVSSIIW